jgi:hypothetical protein
MRARYAIYFAPARDSELWRRAEAWLAQPDLQPLTVFARRYGFHATLKAPMTLSDGCDRAALHTALAEFADDRPPLALPGLAPRLIDGFLALTTDPQPQALTDFAAKLVWQFEVFREPLTVEDRTRRLKAPLTARQVELLDRYGYPYVLEQFQFHMTLTDRLPEDLRGGMQERAAAWFAEVLAEPVRLDRLVLFTEPAPGAAFERLEPDHPLGGA